MERYLLEAYLVCYLHTVRILRYTLEKTEKSSYLLVIECLANCCSLASFIIDLIETSYVGKWCSNLFIWYSYSVMLLIIVALCVVIFTLHWVLGWVFLYGFSKDKPCSWFSYTFWNNVFLAIFKIHFGEDIALIKWSNSKGNNIAHVAVDSCFCWHPFDCFLDKHRFEHMSSSQPHPES